MKLIWQHKCCSFMTYYYIVLDNSISVHTDICVINIILTCLDVICLRTIYIFILIMKLALLDLEVRFCPDIIYPYFLLVVCMFYPRYVCIVISYRFFLLNLIRKKLIWKYRTSKTRVMHLHYNYLRENTEQYISECLKLSQVFVVGWSRG